MALKLPPLHTRIVCRVDAELEPPLEWVPAAAGQRRVLNNMNTYRPRAGAEASNG